MGLLAKLGVPCDWTLCATDPVAVQVHVTVLPTATLSIAGFWVPLWALLNRMFPTTISPAGPPPPPPPPPLPPPPPPPPPYVGDLQPASAASASKPITAVAIRMSFSSARCLARARIAPSSSDKGTAQVERPLAASITGARLAIAPRWQYQTRRLGQARNSGTDLSDEGLHEIRRSARTSRRSGPDRHSWLPPSSRESGCGRCSPSWPRGPARWRFERR